MTENNDNEATFGCMLLIGLACISGSIWSLWGPAYASLFGGVAAVVLAVFGVAGKIGGGK
jgi:uncharacterized membrane protein